jgi:hypothetical protein
VHEGSLESHERSPAELSQERPLPSASCTLCSRPSDSPTTKQIAHILTQDRNALHAD